MIAKLLLPPNDESVVSRYIGKAVFFVIVCTLYSFTPFIL